MAIGKYFEDYLIDEEYVSPGRTVTETDLVLYTGLSGDYNEVHTNEEYCKGVSVYKRRVMHGLFALTLVEGLKSRVGLFEGTSLASLEWRWRFLLPLFIGDTVKVRWKITHKKETSKKDRGIITEFVQLLNQNEEVLGEGEHLVLMQRREPG
ncbi:MAG TPA: MaoC/PaaZ C-terminal domain-containing protein [Spirochaetia bacterium]|nr:MaoC/PaaZ C-terminal domain-containing protein [Spirochaetia bacterium]